LEIRLQGRRQIKMSVSCFHLVYVELSGHVEYPLTLLTCWTRYQLLLTLLLRMTMTMTMTRQAGQ